MTKRQQKAIEEFRNNLLLFEQRLQQINDLELSTAIDILRTRISVGLRLVKKSGELFEGLDDFDFLHLFQDLDKWVCCPIENPQARRSPQHHCR
jgi:hypothetical protein